MNEAEREFVLEIGSFKAMLDQRLAALPSGSSDEEKGRTYALALWEYMLTWKDRLPPDEWTELLLWMGRTSSEELERIEDE